MVPHSRCSRFPSVPLADFLAFQESGTLHCIGFHFLRFDLECFSDRTPSTAGFSGGAGLCSLRSPSLSDGQPGVLSFAGHDTVSLIRNCFAEVKIRGRPDLSILSGVA